MKIISLLVFLSMMTTPFFQTSSVASMENTIPEPQFPYEEIITDLKYVEKEMKNNTSSIDVGIKAQSALNNFSINGSKSREIPNNYTIANASFYQQSVPWVVSTIQDIISPKQTPLEYLSTNPLSYCILTRYKNIVKWTEGRLVPTTTQQIDIDNNSTNGNEIKVSVELGSSILIFNTTISGTLNFLVSKLTQENLSLEIYLIKVVNYGQRSNIWYTGFNFSELPKNFLSTISIQNIVVDIVGAIVGNLLDASAVTHILKFNGPYGMTWEMDTNISGMGLISGYTYVGENALFERSWFNCSFSPRSGCDTIPKKATININDVSNSINTYEWSADSSSRLWFQYGKEAVNKTYMSVNISELPERITLTTYTDDTKYRYINYTSNSIIENLEFYTHEYSLNTSKHNYIRIVNLSTEFFATMPNYGDIESIENGENGRGFVEKLVDNIVWQVTSKFRRIGEIVHSVTDTINKAYSGDMSFVWKSNEYLSEVEFVSVSNATTYLSSNGVFFGVLQNNCSTDFSLSGRLYDVREITINSTCGLHLETRIKEKSSLRILFLREPQILEINITGVSEHTCIEFVSDEIKIISRDAYENYTFIDRVTVIYISNTTNDYFLLKTYNVPGAFAIRLSQNHLGLASEDYIGSIEFVFTNKTIPEIDGGHLFSQRTTNESCTSFKLEKLKSFDLNSSTGTLGVVSLYSKPFWIVVSDNKTGDSSTALNATLFLSALPSVVSIGVPLRNSTDVLSAPSILPSSINHANISTILDFMSEVLPSIKNINKFFSSLTDRVAIFGFASSFVFDKNTSLIASIEKGDVSKIEPVDWRYGITTKNRELNNKTTTNMKIYMDGISKNSSISSYLSKNETILDLNIQDYQGSSNNLILDVCGVGEKNLVFYLGNITKGANITGRMNFTKNEINGIDSIFTKINFTSSTRLGQCYLRVEENNSLSTTNVLIPSMPKQIQMNVSIFGDIGITYNSSEKSKYIYANTSKFEKGKWNIINATLYNVPASLSISLESQKSFDMGDSNLVKWLPIINSKNSDSGANLSIQVDGLCVGQKGSYSVVIENISTYISGSLDADTYRITSPNLNYVSMEIDNLPITEYYRLKSLRITAKNIQTLSIKTSTIFGCPIIELGDTTLEYLDITINHNLILFGMKIDCEVALRDVNLSDIFSTTTRSNSINLSNQKNSNHVIMPAPVKTMIYTIAKNIFDKSTDGIWI